MKIIASAQFDKDFKRLAKKYASLPNDLKELQDQLLENPILGISLGNNCYKIRLSIKSKGKGKSGGARVITFIQMIEEEIVLITMYDKSETENVDDKFLKAIVDRFLEEK